MINRIIIKSDKISFSNSSLIVGRERFLEVPISSMDYIKFYQSTDINAGYIAVVKNEFEDVDIIFFHKDYQEHFKTISNEINTQINFKKSTYKKAG